MKIGVLGAKGFLGSRLVDVLPNVTPITRENYDEHRGKTFDVFINVAGNKFNYWANQFPNEDFKASTLPVYNSLFDFKINKYIFMSSIAVYDCNSHYGFNKILSEDIIKRHAADYIILRCCSVIDKSSDKGIISDAVNSNPLFVSSESKIQFITRDALANIIKTLINLDIKNDLFNVGGIGAIRIGDIETVIGKDVLYQDGAQERHYEMDVCELATIVKLKTSYEYVEDICCYKSTI